MRGSIGGRLGRVEYRHNQDDPGCRALVTVFGMAVRSGRPRACRLRRILLFFLLFSPVDAVLFLNVTKQGIDDEIGKTSVFLACSFLQEGFEPRGYFESDHNFRHAPYIQS